MNTKENLNVYNDPKYWNHDLREEFMSNTRSLWAEPATRTYNGRIFKTRNAHTPEEQLTVQKV